MLLAVLILVSLDLLGQVLAILGQASAAAAVKKTFASITPPGELLAATAAPVKAGDLITCQTCYGQGYFAGRVCWRCNGARKLPALEAKKPDDEQ